MKSKCSPNSQNIIIRILVSELSRSTHLQFGLNPIIRGLSEPDSVQPILKKSEFFSIQPDLNS